MITMDCDGLFIHMGGVQYLSNKLPKEPNRKCFGLIAYSIAT